MLRRAGGSAASYCRTAGVPSLVYAADTCGVAPSVLEGIRRAVAGAASPDAYGRSPDLVFHVLEASGGKTDPAHQTIALPIIRWAAAIWESWVGRDLLEASLSHARGRLDAAGDRGWSSVAGPTAAFYATLGIIRWRAVSATMLHDDTGVEWDLLRNSPAAVRDTANPHTNDGNPKTDGVDRIFLEKLAASCS